jgi:citrate synthase
MSSVSKGLADVIALETRISYIDGLRGKLEYRGYDIDELSRTDYETVAYILLMGDGLDHNEVQMLRGLLRSERDVDAEVKGLIEKYAKDVEALDILRTSVSILGHIDDEDNSIDASLVKGIKLIAKFPTIVALYHRYREGLEPVDPDPNLGHGENFLYMLRGRRPSRLEAKVMDLDFVLSAEHGLNASTFAARIAASTLSDIYSAVISAISTLKGHLHGGARGRVMEMLDQIGYPENSEEYIMGLIDRKERIMGFGHRVYKTMDPRARIYKKYARMLAEEIGDMKWYHLAESVENVVIRELVINRGKPIYPNVDFYSPVIYKYLGIPKSLSTALFAIGRIAGWVAHYIEQRTDNKLIRPRAKYIGQHNLRINLEALQKI